MASLQRDSFEMMRDKKESFFPGIQKWACADGGISEWMNITLAIFFPAEAPWVLAVRDGEVPLRF